MVSCQTLHPYHPDSSQPPGLICLCRWFPSQPPDLATLFCWLLGQLPELLHSTPLKEFFKSLLCISFPSHESCIWMHILSTTLANCDRRSLPNQRVHFIWVQTTPVHDEGDTLMKPTVSHRPQKIQIRLFSHLSKSTKHIYTGGSACHDTPRSPAKGNNLVEGSMIAKSLLSSSELFCFFNAQAI